MKEKMAKLGFVKVGNGIWRRQCHDTTLDGYLEVYDVGGKLDCTFYYYCESGNVSKKAKTKTQVEINAIMAKVRSIMK